MFALLLLAAFAAPDPRTEPRIASDSVLIGGGTAPFDPGSWGLGFRVLGDNSDLRVLRAFSPRFAAGIELGWGGRYREMHRTDTSSAVDALMRDPPDDTWSGDLQLRIGIPLEWAIADRGALHLVAGLVPFCTFAVADSLSAITLYDAVDDTRLGLGVLATLGLLWEFQPGLFLATSFGAEGSRTARTIDDGGTQTRTVGSTISTRSWFGGIGLDAWF